MTHINYTVRRFRNVQMGHHELVGKEKVNKELEHDMVQVHGKQELEGGMEQGMDDKELVGDKELVRDKLRGARDILAFLVVDRV